MSRYLAEALGANEPNFRRGIEELEKSNGHPNSDLRLASDIRQSIRLKTAELGLDPADTTAEELYQALNYKLSADDQKLLKHLRTLAASRVSAEANVADGIMVVLSELGIDQDVYCLKTSALKKQLQASVPKKAMKKLGYRSAASLLKHEPLALVILAINLFESDRYVETFYNKYRGYKATDFESRKLQIIRPKGVKWQSILEASESLRHRQLISCHELGVLLLLPIDNRLEPGQATARLVAILSELSKMLSTSTYLKLNQVSADFGQKLYKVAEDEPTISAKVMNRPIPWHLVQSTLDKLGLDLEMPHLSQEDLNFNQLIDKLGEIIPDFKFWQSTEFLAVVDKTEATSLNILDVAANLTHSLSFDKRHSSHFKNSLWQELMTRYIDPETVATDLKNDLQPSLGMEMAEI